MNLIFIDSKDDRTSLLPVTFTRPISKILLGILTIEEKWGYYFSSDRFSYITESYLQKKFPTHVEGINLIINPVILPDKKLIEAVKKLDMNEYLVTGDKFIACRTDKKGLDHFSFDHVLLENLKENHFDGEITFVNRPHNIFQYNASQIVEDFQLVTSTRKSQPVNDDHTIVYSPDQVFIEAGVDIKAAIINASTGPVYIGKNCQVHEGAVIKGPMAILEGSNLNLGAKIRGGTTIGPFCKIGGEVNNAVIFGYSNKGHEGFLGNAVLGEWCNLGADTNNSNLKNNYSFVKMWDYATESYLDTKLQFCGLVMGDHSKCGINTMFNTGSVVGVSASVFGAGFPHKYIPSFTWGGVDSFDDFKLDQALLVAERALARRGMVLDEVESSILSHIYEITAKFRHLKQQF